MKKIILGSVGPLPESAQLVDVPSPVPAAGEVLVDIDVASVNPADRLHSLGWYAYSPVVGGDLGIEGTGHVSAVGAGVDPGLIGKRVIVLPTGEQGTWGEQVVVVERNVVAIPEGDPLQLAQLGVNPMTAYAVLNDYAALKTGDWIGLTLANSAVGHYVIQLARRAGLHTLSIVRSEEAAARVHALGGDVALVHGEDLAGRIAQVLGGAELQLVIDGEGGATVSTLAAALRHSGTVVAFSSITAEPQQINFGDLLFRNVQMRGFYTVNWINAVSRERLEQVYTELASLVAAGELTAEVEKVYPLADFKAAFEHIGQPGRTGKILLRVGA